MKTLFLVAMIALSIKGYSQSNQTSTAAAAQAEKKGTIIFKGTGSEDPAQAVKGKTSFYCFIYTFGSKEEAEKYATSFLHSDPNISAFAYNNETGGHYSFTFSIKEEKDVKWYLNLFKKNNLSYVKFDGKKVSSVDELLKTY